MIHAAATVFWTSLCCSYEMDVTVKVTPKKRTRMSVVVHFWYDISCIHFQNVQKNPFLHLLQTPYLRFNRKILQTYR